jgi:TolB-like protein/class 3 adenylate cyclase
LSGERVERRLAAILAADVAGYSRLMGADEAGTLARLRAHRRDLIDPKVAEHKGRIVKTAGDGILIEFPSVVEAVACAVAVQQGMAERNAAMPEQQRIVFRIGINLGDVIVEDEDIHGDGVNVAARLESITEPGGICVSSTVRDHIGDRIDVAFDDLGERGLKNIARPVRIYRVHLWDADRTRAASTAENRSTLALPDKPSIAVLPFQNMSGDPEQEYFADGMVEEIITALSRIRWLFVIARNSTFTYKDQAIDVKQVGHELGVRYVLEGAVRKAANRVRITAQLIDAETGAHLWADRFDGALEDVFDLQDQVAMSVAGVIEPALQTAEMRRSFERPTTDLTAYDFYLRALSAFWPMSREATAAALTFAENAIERDPHYGLAFLMAAMCKLHIVLTGADGDPEPHVHQGRELARRALRENANDPIVLVSAAFVLAYFGEDISAMIGLCERGLAQNPSFARGWFRAGFIRAWAGQHEHALEHFETAKRLNPRDDRDTGAVTWGMGMAYFFNRRFEQAAATLLIATHERPQFVAPHRFLAASYAHLGRLTDARAVVAQLRTITPEIVQIHSPWRRAEDRELLFSGLRLAIGDAE